LVKEHCQPERKDQPKRHSEQCIVGRDLKRLVEDLVVEELDVVLQADKLRSFATLYLVKLRPIAARIGKPRKRMKPIAHGEMKIQNHRASRRASLPLGMILTMFYLVFRLIGCHLTIHRSRIDAPARHDRRSIRVFQICYLPDFDAVGLLQGAQLAAAALARDDVGNLFGKRGSDTKSRAPYSHAVEPSATFKAKSLVAALI